MNLLDFLDPGAINLNLTGKDKETILSELVDILVARGMVNSKDTLVASLLEREALGSTGIGHGVAIPHGRSAELKNTVMALGRSHADVNFDAIDGQPTRLFFLLVAPENGTTQYLNVLAKIARLMKDAGSRKLLLEAQTPQQVLEMVKQNER
ncbi:MAG: PTS sugar transporter subunit IIA [Deltaproteobacteria bacterium]|nr:PTS sugar transporter subunit IIA [Deltaproteobacteria bacterium]